ncbi:hypothetical protein H9Q13_17755 [Pontibacter sp. JH31]|uniref:Uncharacterized protein n=1 Tax=Pontibacter aquaedesilientis TaxID=2766980 RepID=A0ABR7XL41_9BACT|nr:hypothetical protein [Pontibacter aquaedesilientis]MBD1399019.1 hypothetical protein [Pontibacter aquaedesilientis]
MKILLLHILLLLSTCGYGQIPVIHSDSNQSNESTIYKNFEGKYDFLIAYTEESYWWSDRQFYQILALKDGQWNSITLASKKKKNGDFRKPTIKVNSYDKENAQLLLSQLDQLGFWTLNSDSLNITQRENPDSTVTAYTLSDAANYKFEIMTKEDYKIIEAYTPEHFLEKLPEIKSRQKFITGRDIFKKALKN